MKQEYAADWVVRAQKIANLGIWDQDPATDDLWWSDETFKILGLDPRSMTPSFEKFLEIVHPEDRLMIVKQTELSLKSDEHPYKIEYRILMPDKSERIVHEEALIERDAKGKPIKITGIIQDITRQKQADEEHIKREKLQAILEMAGAVCHEFNQPLQVISGHCELLEIGSGFNNETKDHINEILKAVSRMGLLTKDVMNITAYETKPYLNSKIVDIKRSTGTL